MTYIWDLDYSTDIIEEATYDGDASEAGDGASERGGGV